MTVHRRLTKTDLKYSASTDKRAFNATMVGRCVKDEICPQLAIPEIPLPPRFILGCFWLN
jgi:hypothetical protein